MAGETDVLDLAFLFGLLQGFQATAFALCAACPFHPAIM